MWPWELCCLHTENRIKMKYFEVQVIVIFLLILIINKSGFAIIVI